MLQSVSELLLMAECRVFNFLESFLLLKVRKEAENCLPAALQFWAIPKIKKLDEKIDVLVFGGKLLKETNHVEPTNQGLFIMTIDGY